MYQIQPVQKYSANDWPSNWPAEKMPIHATYFLRINELIKEYNKATSKSTRKHLLLDIHELQQIYHAQLNDKTLHIFTAYYDRFHKQLRQDLLAAAKELSNDPNFSLSRLAELEPRKEPSQNFERNLTAEKWAPFFSHPTTSYTPVIISLVTNLNPQAPPEQYHADLIKLRTAIRRHSLES